eukprot:GHVQ01040010.1.p1 GENE.GHVQ01040010.1~~GHVQ01040010.1.p1  ORF type:complete len:178 (-),score=23.44 GHVQ01040010.1:37-570(-)
MLVYKDVFTGDEVCSESYPPLSPYDDASFKDIAFEVLSKRVEKGGEDFGIANNVDADAEAGTALGEGADGKETVIDVVDSFKLVECPMGKKDFQAYIRGYMLRLKGHLEKSKPERVEKFMSGAQALVKKILSEFDEYSFYMGESMDAEAGLVISHYVGEEFAPRFIYMIDGLREEKY